MRLPRQSKVHSADGDHRAQDSTGPQDCPERTGCHADRVPADSFEIRDAPDKMSLGLRALHRDGVAVCLDLEP